MFDAYLFMDDVQGGSQSAGFEDHIEVTTFGHEIQQELGISRSMAGAGATGRSEHGSMVFTKRVDKSSPWLLEMCSSGSKTDNAILKLVKATGQELDSVSGDKLVYMEYHMRGVDVQRIRHFSDDDTSLVFEEFGLQYDSITWTYTGSSGKTGGSWNRVTNQAKVE